MASEPSKATAGLDDLQLGRAQLYAIRAMTLVIEVVGRALDVLVLCVRPRLLWAYVRVWGAELWRSPYKWPASFEARRVVNASGQILRELMYGEVLIAPFAWVLARAGVTRTSTVVDVGAGRGRALLAARLLGATARGIELWEPHVRAVEGALSGLGVRLELGDAAQADYSDATHVVLNWCAFEPETKRRIAERLLATCRPGTRFIAMTRPIEGERFALRRSTWALFSWGFERVYLQEFVA